MTNCKLIVGFIHLLGTLAGGEGIAFGSVCLLLAKSKIFQVYWSVYFYLVKTFFLPSMFVCSTCLSICLSVCLSICHTIFGHSIQQIVLNIFVCVGNWPRTPTPNFGEDPNPDPDLGILKWFFTIETGPKTIYRTISQKVMDGLTQNLVDRFGVPRGRIDSILVKIRIQFWIRELFNC